MSENTTPQIRPISFTINGRPVTLAVDVRSSLSEVLRGELGLTSIKKGCDVGECGACTVLIDDVAIDSCLWLAVWVDGKSVRTTEGLASPDGDLSIIQQAFMDATAIQCGFCTPGLLMAATQVLETGEQYDRDELRRRLAGNLCRCTGYENILNAVELAQQRTHTKTIQDSDKRFWEAVSTI